MAWPVPVTGRYFWEHCFWIDRDQFPSNGQMGLAVSSNMRLLYSSNVLLHGQTFYVPGTMVVFFRQTFTVPAGGAQPALTNPTLLIAARWRMRGSDGTRSYHLHRQAIGNEYLDGSVYSTLGRTQSTTRMGTFVLRDIYRTHSGAKIVEGQLAPTPAMWQLRHGTKRKASNFWLP